MKKENQDKLVENLPACAVEFIKLVIRKMRYRKKVRADVQAELTAHFEDELRDCKTDEEKEKRAQQLIAKFGNVKLLAVLLRRAKKRCRPFWRTAVARTFQTVGVIIACFILYVFWFLSGKPVITTNYVAELNRIVCPVADESLNAASLYQRAVENIKLPDERALLGKKYEQATTEEKMSLEKWLIGNEEALALVVAGTKRPYCWWKYETKGSSRMMAVIVPNLTEFRQLARLLCWRAWLKTEQGQYKEAFDDIMACYRFGQHLKGNKFLIEQLVGISIEAIAVQTIRDVIAKYDIDSATLSTLQQEFEKTIASEDFAISLEVERLATFDEIQRSFTGSHHLGEGHIMPKHVYEMYPEMTMIISGLPTNDYRAQPQEKKRPGWLSEFISGMRQEICEPGGFIYEAGSFSKKAGYILFLHPDKQQTFKTAQKLYDYWETLKVRTPAQMRAENIDTEKQTMEIIKGNLLLEFFTPALNRVIELSHRNRIDVEATLVIIAILRYKQDTGNYPDSLEELKNAGYLKQLPMDPYCDKSLSYKKMDKKFILYGVGKNFKDDGGTVAVVDGRPRKWGAKEQGDWVFWPVTKSNEKK